MDVNDEIQDHLMKAMELTINASGNRPGSHALIAQASVEADGTFILTWHRYCDAPS